MKITLTYSEGRACTSRVADDLADAMLEVRRHCWHKSHVYELPAIAWLRILDELRSDAYGPQGGFKERVPSLYSAIAKIAKKVRAFELHPGFQPLMGVVGADPTIIPAFITADGVRKPYPPGEFTLLCPEHLVSLGRTLTVWRSDGWCSAVEHPLHREEFHLRFVVDGEQVGHDR